jgi:hypothetical protein
VLTVGYYELLVMVVVVVVRVVVPSDGSDGRGEH